MSRGFPKQDRKAFISQRAICTKEGEVGENALYAYHLENTNVLMERLDGMFDEGVDRSIAPDIQAIHSPIPCPQDDDLDRVCARYLCWALLESSPKLLYVSSKFKQHEHARCFDNGQSVGPSQSAARIGLCTESQSTALNWLCNCKKQHLRRPDDEATVLPWNTKILTHAAYVSETEEQLQCEWAGEVGHDLYDIGLPEDPDVEEEELAPGMDAPIIDPQRACGEVEKPKHRYGNKWLGERGEFPEHPDICGYQHFWAFLFPMAPGP